MTDEEFHIITTTFGNLSSVSKALERKLGAAASAGPIWRPNSTTDLDAEKAETVMKMISMLEDDDDVQNVCTNFEVSEEVMAQLSANN